MTKKVLYLVGPTCSGKSTISRTLQEKYGYGIIDSIMTRESRNPRDNNKYLDRDSFETLIKEDKFIEYTIYSNEYYGTLKESLLDSFKDNKISVKIIEVSGLMQILKSGFHESTGIDFFVVYLKPEFLGYENKIKSRSDWENRVREDDDLYYTLLRLNCSVIPIKKYEVVANKGSVSSVASIINMLCITKDESNRLLKNLLYLPEDTNISNNKEDDHSHTLTLIDSNYNTNTRRFYLSNSKKFNTVRYLSEMFEKDVHYSDNNYVAVNLKDNGMFAVVSKEEITNNKNSDFQRKE